MVRPVQIAKSNYFILFMDHTQWYPDIKNLIEDRYSKQVYIEIIDFAEKEALKHLQQAFQKPDRFGSGNVLWDMIVNKDEETLDKYLEQDKGKRIPIHYFELLEV